MSLDVQRKWDNIYNNQQNVPEPSSLLVEHRHLLPTTGGALDLACGLGSNSLYLANQGLQVDAWDISAVAIKKLNDYAGTRYSLLNTQVTNITADCFSGKQYEIIAIFRYLDRDIVPYIISALKPGGMLFYQTFTAKKVTQTGPKSPAFLLKRNELLRLFSELQIVFYQENDDIGDHSLGLRNEASLIAEKPHKV